MSKFPCTAAAKTVAFTVASYSMQTSWLDKYMLCGALRSMSSEVRSYIPYINML